MKRHSSLTAPSAVHAFAYVQAEDPGAVGAGKAWIDTSGSTPALKVRSADDTEWLSLGGAVNNRTIDQQLSILASTATTGTAATQARGSAATISSHNAGNGNGSQILQAGTVYSPFVPIGVSALSDLRDGVPIVRWSGLTASASRAGIVWANLITLPFSASALAAMEAYNLTRCYRLIATFFAPTFNAPGAVGRYEYGLQIVGVHGTVAVQEGINKHRGIGIHWRSDHTWRVVANNTAYTPFGDSDPTFVSDALAGSNGPDTFNTVELRIYAATSELPARIEAWLNGAMRWSHDWVDGSVVSRPGVDNDANWNPLGYRPMCYSRRQAGGTALQGELPGGDGLPVSLFRCMAGPTRESLED